MAHWKKYSETDPEYGLLASKLPPPVETDIPTRRIQLAQLLKVRLETTEYPKTGLTVKERPIPVQGGEILIRTYVPDSAGSTAEKYPVLVDLHGGGYSLGNLDSDEIKCRTACVKLRISVVNVDYRLAPEHPWPIGLNDSYEAVKWVANHAEEISGDLSKGFIINGLSAGANFTCSITQRAKDDPELKGKITGQILQIPPTCHPTKDGFPDKYKSLLLSYEENKNDLILSRANLRMFMDAYKPGPADHSEVSPLLAVSFENLPPAYVQVAGGDPLRDEGLLYTQILGESGVPTKLDIYPGVPHGFANYFPLLKVSEKWRNDYDEGVKWLLSFSKT